MVDPNPNAPVYVPNYLVQSILTTIFCCLPFGIVAIIFAAQVNGKLAGGDYAGAVQSSKQAKMWCWISFGLGLAIWVIVILFYAIVIAAAVSAAQHGNPPPQFR
jgi:hypothetical protein